MNNRYIITRTCLQEGSMRLLKYNEAHFSQAGPAQFVDDQGREFTVQIDREHMRVVNLGSFYHAHNLGVNDVMIFTPIAEGRYQVETIVKPHPVVPAPRTPVVKAPETQRVVVSSTPHVREVRMRPAEVPTELPRPADHQRAEGQRSESQPRAVEVQTTGLQSAGSQTARLPTGETQLSLTAAPQPASSQAPLPQAASTVPQEVAAIFRGRTQSPAAPAAPHPATLSSVGLSVEEQVGVFAALTGYRLSHPASGLMRLSTDLGPQHSYSVLLAADPLATAQPAWEESQDEARLLLTYEKEQRPGQARLTREALSTLTEHARLTPMSPIDLRGYWRAGNIDLESAASVTELLSAHLAQRGAFSYVLLMLSRYSANTIINVPLLAQTLGSGVNPAELSTILDTLSRPPFLALTPLQGGQYLLRVEVSAMLGDLADYAQGIRRRVQTSADQIPVEVSAHAQTVER